MGRSKIRTLVVEDTPFVRKTLSNLLAQDDNIEVIGTASNGIEALEAIDRLEPDVVTMDVDMPVMDGITAVKHIMIRGPKPVVMLSGLSKYGSVTLDALRLGAVDFFPKPEGMALKQLNKEIVRLHQKIKQAVYANLSAIKRARFFNKKLKHKLVCSNVSPIVVIIGAHIGSSGCLLRLLARLELTLPISVVVLQEIDSNVFLPYVRELSAVLPWKIHVGSSSFIEPGHCYIASYEFAWKLVDSGDSFCPKLTPSLPAQRLNPLDLLIKQATNIFGSRLIVVLLSGDTNDGIEGVLEAQDKGANILILDPKECVFPKTSEEALKVTNLLPYNEQQICSFIGNKAIEILKQ